MTTQPEVPIYPCPWPTATDCLPSTWSDLQATVRERAVALASATLQRLTGYRVASCAIKVRPCNPDSFWNQRHAIPPYDGWQTPFRPSLDAYGVWVNHTCGRACESGCEVVLPAPVGRVDEVRVDGAVVPPEDYQVHSGRTLVWTGDGDCPFPRAQDLSKPDTETDTFSVTYLNGHPVDSMGACAVSVLAGEYAKAITGGSKCRLPSGVTSVVRQGVTIEVSSGAFPGGMTGIREVDAYIALWNPKGQQRQTSVWSPDLPKNRTTS